MKKIKALILSTLLSCALFGQSVETKGFSPTQARPNSVVNYTLEFKDVKGRVDVSTIPLPDGLRIVGQNRSQNYSLVNGAMSSSTSISLSMLASKEGTLTIPAWKIEVGGKSYDIKAASVNIDPNAPEQMEEQDEDPFSNVFGFGSSFAQRRAQAQQQARKQTQSFEANFRNSAKLEIKLRREKVYVGESVPCELVFSFDKSLAERGFTLAQLLPEIKKADDFDMPAFSEKPIVDTSSDQSKILVKYNTAITPLKAGTYDLDFSAKGVFNRELRAEDMMSMSIFDRMSSFGSRQIPFEVNMPSKKVEVSPLPEEGKPDNFTGAIGNFSLENVTVSPDALTVGEPCTIFAKIVGIGNFPRIQEPKLDAGNDWKTYKAKSSFTDESNGLANIGIKTFEYTAVPKKADIPFAPTVVFNYFDPVSAKYVEIKSEQIAVSVAPTGRSKRAKAMAEEIATKPALDEIIETPNSNTDNRLLASPYFWAIQILILLVLVAFIVARRENLKRANDVEYAKRLRCERDNKQYIKRANFHADKGEVKEFFDNAKTALQYALAANNEKEARAITPREALEIMRKKNFEESDIEMVGELFEGADAIAYGALDAKNVNISKLADNLKLLSKKILKNK